jgi:hypothetical protein
MASDPPAWMIGDLGALEEENRKLKKLLADPCSATLRPIQLT